ncbi:uncharacterized protein LOC116943177 [Petromyzon marinus]|uniref:Uncharacterized protein LOC116943177 n=1 Tax=Petromyzon marinus TaxID=7757 RepID=A0AAJ7T5N5_PETMA|nr:uncharacterized protein LOC116943177 [Petromyzon marinus]
MKRRPWRAAVPSDEASGARALADATRRGQVRAARFVLDALDGRPVNARGPEGHTPLMLAALLPDAAASAALVELLLRRGADPALEDRWGDSALVQAAAAGNAGVLRSLVRAFDRRGIDVHRPNRDGHSALQVARWLGHHDCVAVLSACGGSRSHVEPATQVDAPPPPADGRWTTALSADGPHFKVARPARCYGTPCRAPLPDVLEEPLSTSFFTPQTSATSSSAADYCPTTTTSSSPDARCGNPRAASRLSILRQRLNSMDSIEEEFDGDDTPTGSCGEPVPKAAESQSVPRVHDNRRSFLPPVAVPGDASKPPAAMEPLGARSQIEDHPPSRSRRSLPEVLLHGEQASSLKASKNVGQLRLQFSNCQVDDGVRRFNDCYYQKRSSLPCSSSPLAVAAPADKLLPLRKGKSPATLLNARASPLHALGTRLLRRFTAPEFARRGVVQAPGACEQRELEEEATPGTSRCEASCPVSRHKQQVSSQPSVDSISGVKCEFDFQSVKNSKEP